MTPRDIELVSVVEDEVPHQTRIPAPSRTASEYCADRAARCHPGRTPVQRPGAAIGALSCPYLYGADAGRPDDRSVAAEVLVQVHPDGIPILEQNRDPISRISDPCSSFAPVRCTTVQSRRKTRSPTEPVYAGQRAICMPFIQVELRGLEPLTLTLPV